MKTQGILADLVMRNGTIITVDDKNTIAEAVAVLDGKIVTVGANEDMEAFIGGKTKFMDLTGKTLVPGFIDSHVHNLTSSGFSTKYVLKFLNVAAELNPSIGDLQRRIRERVKEIPKGDWIVGKYYDSNAMKEQRWPTKEELDAAAPENPVSIRMRGSRVIVAANSMALKAAGITKDTPNPEGGIIEKDPVTGEPTGILRKIRFNFMYPMTLDDLKDGLVATTELQTTTGVTSTGDGGSINKPEAYRAYQEALAEGRLKTRTYLMIHEDFYRKNDLGLRTGFGNDRLRLGAVKIIVDGNIQGFTCAFSEPYVTKDTRGLDGLLYTQERLNEVVADSHSKGYQIAAHAQGDISITMVINAIEYAMEKYPRPDPRHRIEHLLCPKMEDLKRMKELGIIGNFYLFHPWFWGDHHINKFIGKERASKMVPIKTAIKMGIVSCAHSDCLVCVPNDPVWPSNPLWGMWCGVNRKTRSGADIGPQERLTPMEALRAYTINGAYASFEENIKGSIEAGKLADMVVLSDNPLEVDPWEIRDITVEKTVIGGEIVYENK